MTYLAWARRQFPTTGFCIDFRAQWLKSRHGCPSCDRYDVRKAGDIDRLCENETTRTKVLTQFSSYLNTEILESIEYLMCSRPHGARSFAYSLDEDDKDVAEVIFKGIHHLGWPELSVLLQTGRFSDLTVDMNEQRVTIQFVPPSTTPVARDEIAIALVGYYLRLDHRHPNDEKTNTKKPTPCCCVDHVMESSTQRPS